MVFLSLHILRQAYEFRMRAEIIKSQSRDLIAAMAHEIGLFDTQVTRYVIVDYSTVLYQLYVIVTFYFSLIPSKVLSKTMKYLSMVSRAPTIAPALF